MRLSIRYTFLGPVQKCTESDFYKLISEGHQRKILRSQQYLSVIGKTRMCQNLAGNYYKFCCSYNAEFEQLSHYANSRTCDVIV